MGYFKCINWAGEQENWVEDVLSLIPCFTEKAKTSGDLNRLFFLITLDEMGLSHEAHQFLTESWAAYEKGKKPFESTVAACIIQSPNAFHTKSFAKHFIFSMNRMGCQWIGHPVTEMLPHYANFKTWCKQMKESGEKVFQHLVKKQLEEFFSYKLLELERPKILVLHAGDSNRSNTLMMWHAVEEKLSLKMSADYDIETLHVEDGKVRDCFGCTFETCTYHALDRNCFYGGFVVDSLYPAIEKADFIIWISPNYNDSVSAKLMAVVNRLTALYRHMSFKEKYILSVIVSANSGSDCVASQLIGALNINKGFRLPPHFAFFGQANAPREILENEDFNSDVDQYVQTMYELLNKNIKKNT